jgi:hypothetical protein
MSRFALRTQTTDLDRFRIMVARKNRAYKARKVAFKALGGKGTTHKKEVAAAAKGKAAKGGKGKK